MMRVLHLTAMLCIAASFASVGCKGSSASERSAPSAASGASAPSVLNLPEKGAWDAVKITYTHDDPTDGAPTFKLENLGRKTVSVCFVAFYGYDASGKQLARKELSWNGTVEGGKSDDKLNTQKVDGVKTWEATYYGIRFETDKEPTMDEKRAPPTRAMGASAPAVQAAAGAAAGADDYSGLTGRWINDDWGLVKLDGKTGTYTDTYGGGIGTFEFTQTGPRAFDAVWRESKARHGTMTVTLSDDAKSLDGKWTPDPDCTIGRRYGGPVHWKKR